mgnify:CR=1 FL=1
MELNEELGHSDILLIDQILKGRFKQGMRILDAGCGEGRNMTWFIRNGYQIYGIDQDKAAIRMGRLLARSLNRDFTLENLWATSIEDNPFPDQFFDIIFSINVLHFARNKDHFRDMAMALSRILKPKGKIFISMSSTWGLGDMKPGREWHQRLLWDDPVLDLLENYFSLDENEPIRTLQVKDKDCLTYVWMEKNGN